MRTEDEILKTCHTIAVVGLSPDPNRPSNRVSAYMLECGYQIIPVNPTCSEVLGQKSYAKLTDVPVPVDAVNVFRRSEEVLAIIDDAIKIKAKAVWLQEGVIDKESGKKAKEAGLLFVEDE